MSNQIGLPLSSKYPNLTISRQTRFYFFVAVCVAYLDANFTASVMPFASSVIEISDSDDDTHALPPSSSQFSQQSFDSELIDICSSDDELPAPGDPAFFQRLKEVTTASKRRRHSSPEKSSRPSSVDYPEYAVDSSDEDESPKKVARKVSGMRALRYRDR
jgi:hypothetical protein